MGARLSADRTLGPHNCRLNDFECRDVQLEFDQSAANLAFYSACCGWADGSDADRSAVGRTYRGERGLRGIDTDEHVELRQGQAC